MGPRPRTPWVDDVAARYRFERGVKRRGYPLRSGYAQHPRRINYELEIDVPVFDDRRRVQIGFMSTASPAKPVVHVDGPPCQRHRWDDESLCMWLAGDPALVRWVPADGLLALISHIEEHTWCEGECRAGRSWPKAESPGEHPRKRSCPSCRGQGR
jgi:hypothetical protein